MNPPDPFPHCLPGEDPDDLMALYRDVLHRSAPDPENASPLDVFLAWECTLLAWQTRRLGEDPQRVLSEAYGMAPLDRRAREEVDSAHRQRLRTRFLDEIKTLKAITKALKGDIDRSLEAAGAPSHLRVVE